MSLTPMKTFTYPHVTLWRPLCEYSNSVKIWVLDTSHIMLHIFILALYLWVFFINFHNVLPIIHSQFFFPVIVCIWFFLNTIHYFHVVVFFPHNWFIHNFIFPQVSFAWVIYFHTIVSMWFSFHIAVLYSHMMFFKSFIYFHTIFPTWFFHKLLFHNIPIFSLFFLHVSFHAWFIHILCIYLGSYVQWIEQYQIW